MWFNFKHVIAEGIAHVLKDKHMLPCCAVQGLGRGTPPQRAPQMHPSCRLEGGQPGGQHLLITPFFHSLPAFGTAEGDTEPAWVAEGLWAQQRCDMGKDEPGLACPQPLAKHRSQEPAAVRAGQTLPAGDFWEAPGIANLPGPCTLADLSR